MFSGISSKLGLMSAVGMMLVSGCGTDYAWRASVPEQMRTVSCPTFRNESEVMEAGAIAARQVLRELQREGTFKIKTNGDAALEIQGVVKSASGGAMAYDRRHGMRQGAYDLNVTCAISIIDKRRHAVLVDGKPYTGNTSFTASQDFTTAQRDAIGRALDDMAQQVVDDLRSMKFEAKGANHE